MNVIDVILIILIALAIIWALRVCIRNKKNGKCCGDCSYCAGCGKKEEKRHEL